MNNLKLLRESPVFPIPYICWGAEKYLEFLHENGVKNIMTTAGTTGFNLLTPDEIYGYNSLIAFFSENNGWFDNIILGLPNIGTEAVLKEIDLWNTYSLEKISFLAMYPDRYYDDDTIKIHFWRLADRSKYPILIHGKAMESAYGGMYDYTSELIYGIQTNPNIWGIKEEHSAFEGAYNICNDLKHVNNFYMIVAGGDQRRFLLTNPVGADTFLAGAGSIYPHVDIGFFDKVMKHDMGGAYDILNTIHNPLYDTFKEIGWHKALKEALRLKDFSPAMKEPISWCTDEQAKTIKECLYFTELELERIYG